MRPENIENAPAPGAEAEGAGPALAGSGAGSPETGASTGGMSPELKTKWEEFVEEETTKYVIRIPDVTVEDDTVTFKRIELVSRYFPIYPYGNYVETLYEIEWDGADAITIEAKCVHDSWGGTGCEPLGKLTVEVTLPETPWFFDYDELTRRIEENGVKETIERIIDDIIYLAKVALGGEE
jgi:hypothetical protein